MPNQELIDYINKAREQNMSEEDIRASLKEGGWSNEDINGVFSNVENEKQEEEQDVELEPKKKAGWKKWVKRIMMAIFSIGVVLYGFILILPYILGYIFPDIEEVNDSALKLEIVEIADEDNAYFDLMKAAEVLDLAGDDYEIIKGEITDPMLIEDLLARNKESLFHFRQASTKSYVNPKMIDPDVPYMNVELPPLNTFRNLGKLNSFVAVYYASQGLFEDSYNTSMTTLHVGDAIQHASMQPLIENLVAKAIVSFGLEGLQRSITISSSTIYDVQEKMLSLDNLYDSEQGTILALKMEYLSGADAFDAMVDGRFGSSDEELKTTKKNKFYFQPNRTKQLLADSFQYIIERKENPNKPQLDTWVNFIEEVDKKDSSSYITKMFSRNLAGEIIVSVIIASLNNTQDERIDVYVGATQLTLALKGYYQEHGELPLSLDVLVPEYFIELPVDPFSGDSMKYDPERKVIYSVGWNKIDDGGLLKDEEGKDTVFSVNFKQIKNDFLDETLDTQVLEEVQ